MRTWTTSLARLCSTTAPSTESGSASSPSATVRCVRVSRTASARRRASAGYTSTIQLTAAVSSAKPISDWAGTTSRSHGAAGTTSPKPRVLTVTADRYSASKKPARSRSTSLLKVNPSGMCGA